MALAGPCYFFFCRQWFACGRLWWTAEISYFSEAFFHSSRKLGRRGLFAAVEAGDAEKDALGLGVIAGTVPIGHHRPIAAKHLHGCGHLEERGQVQSCLFWNAACGPARTKGIPTTRGLNEVMCFPDFFPLGRLTELTKSTNCFSMEGYGQSHKNKPI